MILVITHDHIISFRRPSFPLEQKVDFTSATLKPEMFPCFIASTHGKIDAKLTLA